MKKSSCFILIFAALVAYQNCSPNIEAGLRAAPNSANQGDPNSQESADSTGSSTGPSLRNDEAVSFDEAAMAIRNNADPGAGRVEEIFFGFNGFEQPQMVLNMSSARISSVAGIELSTLDNEVFSDIIAIITSASLRRSEPEDDCTDGPYPYEYAILKMGDGTEIQLSRVSSSCGFVDFFANNENAELFEILLSTYLQNE